MARLSIVAIAAMIIGGASAFAPHSAPKSVAFKTSMESPTALEVFGGWGDDMMKRARAMRSADADDRVVELNRPLGIVLKEDPYGNVFVEKVAPRGNAARNGNVC